MNELATEQEQGDDALLTATEDGDRRIVFKRDLTVEFSNNSTQVIKPPILPRVYFCLLKKTLVANECRDS